MMPIRLRPILALFALAAATASAQQAAPPPAPDAVVVEGDIGKRVDEYMTRLSRFGLSGSLLVARDGAVILQKSYGLADRSTNTPIRPEMLFSIGSLSKQFTAAAILKLQMQGKLRVTDTLGHIFPDAPDDKAGITLHQLLTHTAGFPYLWNADMSAPMTREEARRHLLNIPLALLPGTMHAYSNSGYSLLACVIERVSGMPYKEYLRQNLFEPAGLERTGFEGEPDRWNGGLAIHSYSDAQDEGPLSSLPVSAIAVGAGTIISTVNDMYRWELALRTDKVLSSEARAEFFAPHVATQAGTRYGYGWNVARTPRNTTVITHAGDFGGYNAEMRRYPDENMVVIFTSNAAVNGTGYRAPLINNLVFLITGKEYQQPPTVVSLPPQALERYAGTYRFPAQGMMVARDTADGLMVGAFDQATMRLLAGTGEEYTAVEKEFGEQARDILEGINRNDLEPLRKALHPGLSFEGMAPAMRAMWGERVEQLGAYERLDVLGTGVTSPQAARSYVRAHFKRGDAIMLLAWSNGTVAGVRMDVDLPMATQFHPASDSEFVNFDIFTGRTVRIMFGPLSDGKPSALTIRTATGEAMAKRSRG